MTTRNKVKNLLIIFFLVAVMGSINFCYLKGYCKFGADLATNNVTNFSLITYANFETVSVYANIIGDNNNNSTASFKYKESGASDWIEGMEMSPIYDSKNKAGFFFTEEDISYDIQLTIIDIDGTPENSTSESTITTRNSFAPSNGTNYYVSNLSGNDTNDGTFEHPFKTINKASTRVTAGSTVNIMGGTYRERINFGNTNPNQRGTANNWIKFTNYNEEEVVLDGSYETLPQWEEFDPVNYPSIYRIKLDWFYPFYVNNLTIDEETVYRFTGLDALKANETIDRLGQTVKPVTDKFGWARDETTDISPADGKVSIYLQIFQDDTNPNNHSIRLARPPGIGFAIDATDYINVNGLTFKNYAYGVRITSYYGSFSNIIIDNNKFVNSGLPISIGSGTNEEKIGSNITIQNNTITSAGLYGLNWSALKNSSQEWSGVSISNIKSGTVVRNNTISGYFNGIFMGSWPPKYGYSHDADIYSNNISNGGDDGTELEGTDTTNVRVWDNHIKNFGTTLSATPLLTGPLYFFRNIGESVGMGVKLGSAHVNEDDPSSKGYLYVYHNTINANYHISNGNRGYGTYCTNPPTFQNSKFINNIFNLDSWVIYHGLCTSENVKYDYNLMYSNGNNTSPTGKIFAWDGGQDDNTKKYSSVSELFAATGQAEHTITLPPIFQNFAESDFRLANNSPGIDFGTPIKGFNDCNSPWPLSGVAPDVGTYETASFNACAPPPIINPPIINPPIDNTNYLFLPIARFTSSWNMVSFPDTSGSVSNNDLAL
jgi:hypothetical protein